MDALCRRLRDLARELDEALPDADASPPDE
jgi:hypothetical protein